MNKKVWIPISIAALIALVAAGLWVSDEASAQGTTLFHRFQMARRGLGQVTAVSTDRFTIKRLNEQEITFLVTENTLFRDREGNELSFSDLQEGQWVVVRPALGEEGTIEARLVIVMPPDFDPTSFSGARGVIASIDLASSQLLLENWQGEENAFSVNEDTLFRGAAGDLAEIEEGMRAWVLARSLEDDGLLAVVVRTFYPHLRKVGEITSVDLDSASFILKAVQSGEEYTFFVDDGTRFRLRGGEVAGLEALQPGMKCVVIAREESEASASRYVAIWVAAASPEDLPQFDLRVLGRITSIGADQISVENSEGEVFTFTVNEDTRFRSRGGMITSLDDLQEGMFVLVGAAQLEDGSYVAQLIVARPSPFR